MSTLGINVAERVQLSDGLVGAPPPSKPAPIEWRAWYDDGTAEGCEYSSTTHDLGELPPDGFLAMVLFRDGQERPFRVISGNDVYWYAPHTAGPIFGQSGNGTLTQAQVDAEVEAVRAKFPGALVWRGKIVPDALMEKISEMMAGAKAPEGCKGC